MSDPVLWKLIVVKLSKESKTRTMGYKNLPALLKSIQPTTASLTKRFTLMGVPVTYSVIINILLTFKSCESLSIK
jgi:hypothetical protein